MGYIYVLALVILALPARDPVEAYIGASLSHHHTLASADRDVEEE